MHDLVPLKYLAAGQSGLVENVLGGSDHVHRMHELGLREGAEIEMMRCGSPCIVRLGEQRLCLRCDELGGIMVRIGRVA